jgi:hypothetical protein
LDSQREDGEFAVYAHIGCLDMDPEVKLHPERFETGAEDIRDVIQEGGKALGIKAQEQDLLSASDLITLLIALLLNL